MRGLIVSLGLASLAVLACAAKGPDSPSHSVSSPAPVTSAPPLTPPSHAPQPAPLAAPTRAEPPLETAFPFDVERVLDVGIVALSVERAPHVAALTSDKAFIHTGKGWQEVALPTHPHLTGAGGVRELFYGRDYRPRLVVNVDTEAGPDRSYFRWLPAGFKAAPDELGPLARKVRPTGAAPCPSCTDNRLVAVLGNEDPEIICRPRDVCVVKRVTGWSTFAAPEGVRYAAISRGKAFLLAGRSLLSVEDDKRVQVLSDQGPWSEARGLVAVDGALWVLDASATLYRFDGRAFRSFVSPVGPPRTLWGASETELWAGGQQGLARFDGERFLIVSSLPGDVTALGGRGKDELWIGGSTGLRCAKRRR